jgi:hypothetical protein
LAGRPELRSERHAARHRAIPDIREKYREKLKVL